MFRRAFQPGDRVVFRMLKHSFRPGRRAQEVEPAEHGEAYTYRVKKFWLVQSRGEAGRLIVKTRRGKTHLISEADPNLRHASLLELLWFRSRFPR